MDLLEAQHLSRYQRGEPLFQPLDLRLASGMRVGLVGPNGAGKSTLLQLLTGSPAPDGGRVVRAPGVRVALLPQSSEVPSGASVWEVADLGLQAVHDAEARLRSEERRLAAGEPRSAALAEAHDTFDRLGGYRAEADLREILAAVGFSEAAFDRPAGRLSGGERRRLALATVLAGGPEVLLLDEPTNHLDLAMRNWLAGRLAAWRGALVLVSHDRSVLEASTNATLFLEGGAWRLRRGSYGRAREARDRDLLALRRRDAVRAREAERLRSMAAELARRGDRAAVSRRRTAQRQRAQLGAPDAVPAGTRTTALELHARGLKGVLLEGRWLRRDGLFEVPFVRLQAGQRVALLGPNGVGKSTLLALLAGDRPSDDARAELRYPAGLRLAHMGQLDRGLRPDEPVVRQLAQGAGETRARQLLAQAGVAADRWEDPPERLSGGERARAGLAALEAREADLILLDEPTNDLDLAAVEALEGALGRSPAALVLATHDRRLAEALGAEVWALDGGMLRRFRDVGAYLAGEAGTALEPEGPDPERTEPGATDFGPTVPEVPGAPAVAAPGPSTATRGDRDALLTRAPADTGGHGTDAGLARAEALEDERRAVEHRLEDPTRLAPRELERLTARRSDLEDLLTSAYDALLEPPAPRFRVRERGLEVVADRLADDLLVMAVPDMDAPKAMDRLLRAEAGGDGAAVPAPYGPWPWARVHREGSLAHVALFEPRGSCLLPWARAALADAAARFAFTLLDVTALQLFSRDPLPGTHLEDAGDGWWSWTRTGFAQREGLPPELPGRTSQGRHRGRRRGRRSGAQRRP